MMKLAFPSREFDDAVAAICCGTTSDEQARALNELLRGDASARDEYILRLELHSRLASEPDLFLSAEKLVAELPDNSRDVDERSPSPLNGERAGVRGGHSNTRSSRSEASGVTIPDPHSLSPSKGEGGRRVFVRWAVALAACVAILAAGWWGLRPTRPTERQGTTSKAVAMLNRVADAQWNQSGETPRLGAPLEPGWLRLKSGLAQIVFYSGARVVIEGPADLQLISPNEASCRSGRLTADVPPQARGFRVETPQMNVTDLGTTFGLDVKDRRTELHVFKGRVGFESSTGAVKQNLEEGAGAVTENSRPPNLIAADPAAFASLFDLQFKSSAAEVLRHEQWRAASGRLDEDPSLLVHFDFEQTDTSEWRLRNASKRKDAAPDATIVGCQWTEGRWPDKRALEFRGVSDRVRLSVPGEFESLTLAAWVRVQGLDRQFNSLFMSDAFEAGTLHWLIRKDGVLGLTVIGSGSGDVQIVASPSVLTLDQFGMWMHVALVLDGSTKRVVHYVNGVSVREKTLKMNPPFRIGAAELGNWNASGFPDNDPSLIRNFSGAMDEFCLFGRALNDNEIRALYSAGKPQPDSVAELKTN
jgi:hypothetical protein